MPPIIFLKPSPAKIGATFPLKLPNHFSLDVSLSGRAESSAENLGSGRIQGDQIFTVGLGRLGIELGDIVLLGSLGDSELHY